MPVGAMVLATVVLAGCSGQRTDATPEDTLSRRARDSVIGASTVPGAGGVRAATRAADSATARRLREQAVSDTP